MVVGTVLMVKPNQWGTLCWRLILVLLKAQSGTRVWSRISFVVLGCYMVVWHRGVVSRITMAPLDAVLVQQNQVQMLMIGDIFVVRQK